MSSKFSLGGVDASGVEFRLVDFFKVFCLYLGRDVFFSISYKFYLLYLNYFLLVDDCCFLALLYLLLSVFLSIFESEVNMFYSNLF